MALDSCRGIEEAEGGGALCCDGVCLVWFRLIKDDFRRVWCGPGTAGRPTVYFTWATESSGPGRE